ncbi:hypothetical protein [Cupriavidus basilensis]|uniref:Uncharacterized protein n=1 Tax=Cupriavidus basilensis TaxID=68895 RepID=A0A643FSL8_9BURK|nr:hypothetical protein [Cupriavidus basilensis]QOT82237.1 hypothetical protein F7R26_039705 [Cupriavidus basilensis]
MAKFNFRRGEAVIHYSLVGPHRGYWGRKVGAFRVLATSPSSLDSGACISESDLGHTIFPAPNEHGVYDERHAKQFAYRSTSGRDHAVAYVLHIGPDRWAYSFSLTIATGGYCGFSSGISDDHSESTEESATRLALTQLIVMLRDTLDNASVTNPERRRKAVRSAIIALLSQLSLVDRTAILKAVNEISKGG